MVKIYFLVFSAILLASCGPSISYIGNSYSPTSNVDVYVDETAIPKDYTVVGKGYVHYYRSAVPESLQSRAVAKARQKGADAILVKDYFVPVTQSSGLTTTVRKDSAARSVLALAPQVSTSEVVVLFLKYK